jgi:hypothetical protein
VGGNVKKVRIASVHPRDLHHQTRRLHTLHLFARAVFAAALFGATLPSLAQAAPFSPIQQQGPVLAQPTGTLSLGYTPSKTEAYKACPPASEKDVECFLVADPAPIRTSAGYALPNAGPMLEGGGIDGGYDPQDLQSAYGIPTSGGETQTVAIVDAYGDPTAESDLAEYRNEYALGACTKASGCFRKVNEKGEEANYPKAEKLAEEEGWGEETSLDLDMVSAACPKCHILLVEGVNPEVPSLAKSEAEAAKLGATEISNSYGLPERYCAEVKCSLYAEDYDPASIPVTVSAGDSYYDNLEGTPNWPAASPNVIAVGGTELKKAENARGWSETVWEPSGGGCSLEEAKPLWQGDASCSKRTGNDVASVAESISIYSTFRLKGWGNVGGTSAGAPLLAGIEAHAASAVRSQKGEAFYRHKLYDITSGRNGTGCGRTYLCEAEQGYDGPTGWGTPDGPLETAVGFRAVTSAATAVTGSSAKLNGYVDPEGTESTYHFEYGPTTSYGTTVPIPDGKVESGVRWKSVSQNIAGLKGTYHYRLVATNKTETVYGGDQTLTTAPWVIHPTPNPSGSGESTLSGVSCSSSVSCIAVASYNAQSENTRWPLAEHWTGSEWQMQTVPRPSEAQYAVLYDVSCSASNACTAVGEYDKAGSETTWYSLAERWNGSGWSIQATPNPAGFQHAELIGISCPSATSCTAVGSYTTTTGSATLAEHWNGISWSIQTTANPSAGTDIYLIRPSCSSTTNCEAVGYYRNSSSEHVTLAERWNGSAWSLQSTSNPSGSKSSYLVGLSCSGTTACTAVGSYEKSSGTTVGLIERWNGSAWSLQTAQALPGSNRDTLAGVACPTELSCTAVGETAGTVNGSGSTTLAESWNGTEWTLQGTPFPEEPVDFEAASLKAVSCAGVAVCTAVGSHVGETAGSFGLFVTLAESFAPPVAESEVATGVGEGGATLNGAVNPLGQETTYHFEYGKTTLYGTTIPVPDAVVGAGTGNVKVSRTISGLEAGTTYHYRVVATNSLGTTGGEDRTFKTTEYIGTWKLTSTSNPAETQNSDLWGTSCTAPGACIAVGQYEREKSTTTLTLAERWNGTEWTVQTTPNISGAKATVLYQPSCASTSACIAVGYSLSASGVYYSVAEIWNGTEWKLQSVPEPTGTLSSVLESVSCTTAAACTSVGYYENSSGVTAAFAVRWNGAEWKVQSVPDPVGAKVTAPAAVSCTAAGACTMAGKYENGSGTTVPFAESWNGTEWSLQSAPNPSGSISSEVRSVSCTSATACTMVGTYSTSTGSNQGYAERLNGTEWKIQTTAVPSGSKAFSLDGVSCASARVCMATGVNLTTEGKDTTLAERWNGSEWSVLSTPNNAEGQGWLSGGVSCASTSSCAAVGNAGKTLAEVYG